MIVHTCVEDSAYRRNNIYGLTFCDYLLPDVYPNMHILTPEINNIVSSAMHSGMTFTPVVKTTNRVYILV